MRVHLATDMVACGMIRASGVSETDIVWAPDMLSLGPVTPPWEQEPDVSRRAFWTSLYKPFHDMPSMPDAYDAMCKAESKFAQAKEILIWAGSSVDEQLFFVWCVAVLLHMGVDKKKFRYLLVTEDPHYHRPTPSLIGLSQEGYAATIQTDGYALSDEHFEALNMAWKQLRSTDPTEIVRCRKEIPPILSMTFDRINRLKLHYPCVRTGLNRFDYRVLQLCAKCGPRVVSMLVEYLCNDHDEFDRPGDVIFHARLLKLASTELLQPLLEVEGNVSESHLLTVKLTETGKAVLAGEANHVELNGIDEWIGGVHLKTPGPVWYYDPARDNLTLKD